MAKKSVAEDRRAKVEELRRAQAGAERRRTMLVVGSALAVVLVLAGIVTKVVLDQVAEQDMTNVGLTASAASCDPLLTDPAPASGTAVHVGPGTDQASITQVKYATVPPSNGEHFVSPVYPSRAVYTPTDRPVLEQLVHNLEHGYTILWYTSTLPKAQVSELERLAALARKDTATAGKFIASSWDDARGAFPAGKTVALVHWSSKNGLRQLCGGMSGAAVKSFIEAHPYTDSPEPNAQ